MSNDRTLSTANTIVTDRNIPVYHDGTPITHDGNDATIAGAIHEIGLWSTREDRFETLLSHHAVSIKGRIYLDSTESYSFISSSQQASKVQDPVLELCLMCHMLVGVKFQLE